MSYDTILVSQHDGVMTLTINRPARKNAFNIQQYNDISAALRAAKDDVSVQVVVLTGCEGAFSAGQDLTDATARQGPAEAGPAGFPGYVEALFDFDKPLLAAVNGVAVGVGVTTLFHCDVVYVAESARLRLPFASLGIVAEAASSYLLPALIGHQKAAEILYTGRWLTSADALEFGMCAKVLPDDKVLAETQALAAEIALQAPSAVRETKRLLMAIRQDGARAAHERELAALGRCFGSPENMEAVMAFMQKRKPDFVKLRQAKN